MTAPITNVTEALKLLNIVVERGETNIELGNVHSEDELSYLQAMVKNARTVLKEHESFLKRTQGVAPIGDDPRYDAGLEQGERRTLDRMLIAQANDYRPAMVELGWWPK